MVVKYGSFHNSKRIISLCKTLSKSKMENFLDVHVQAFNKIGGIHRELVYDNMKQAVKKFVGRNEKEAN